MPIRVGRPYCPDTRKTDPELIAMITFDPEAGAFFALGEDQGRVDVNWCIANVFSDLPRQSEWG